MRVYFLYITVFVTGAAVLIIEILGTRVLAPFYGSTIFVWSSLISVTLGFLALGYLIGGNWVDRKPNFSNLYGIIFFAAIALVLTIKLNRVVLVFSDQFGLRFGPLVASTLLFAIPLFLLGMITPFAIRLRTQLIEKVGTRSGSIFAIATFGSLIGALLSGFFLIPILSITNIFYITAISLMVISIIGFFISSGEEVKKNRYKFFLLVLIFFIIFLTPLFNVKADKNSRILFQKQSFYGDIKIITVGPYTCLYVNAAGQSCIQKNKTTDSLYVQQVMEVINSSDRVFKDILLLGMGGGSVFSALPHDVVVDTVEIDPDVAMLAEKYQLIPEKNYQLFINDARRFIAKNSKKYDLILIDLAQGASFPSYMFTKEAFESVSANIKEGGILFVRIGFSPSNDNVLLASLYRTMKEVFGDNITLISPYQDRVFSLNLIVGYQGLGEGKFIHKVDPLSLFSEKLGFILTDNFNPIENSAFSFFQSIRESTKTLGIELLFAS